MGLSTMSTTPIYFKNTKLVQTNKIIPQKWSPRHRALNN